MWGLEFDNVVAKPHIIPAEVHRRTHRKPTNTAICTVQHSEISYCMKCYIIKNLSDILAVSGLLRPMKSGKAFFEFSGAWKDTSGSVQLSYKQILPNSGPPLNKQSKHGLRPPTPLKCLYIIWWFIQIRLIYRIKFKLSKCKIPCPALMYQVTSWS